MILLYIVLLLIIFFLAVVLYFFSLAFVRKDNTDIENFDSEFNSFLASYTEILNKGMKFIKNTEHTRYETFSFDGLKLSARYYDRNSNNTIILFHGYRSSAAHDFSCAVEMYYNMGFNILLVDQRSHGLSEGKLITFGVKESRDVISWIEFLNAKFSPEKIVLSGLSMGATTVLLALKNEMPKNVKCVIADCGFTSPIDIIKKVAKQSFKIDASFYIPIMDFFCKIFGNFSIKNISTVDAIKNINVPILLIHGTNDNFVPCEMSKLAFESANENSKLVLVDGADHGISYLVDTKRVTEELNNFISENLG